MRILLLAFACAPVVVLPAAAVLAETVGITNQPVYVTRDDCRALVQHHPAPDVAYKPGVDVHGRYVAPADLPGGDFSSLVPTNSVKFTLQINPMNYAKGAQANGQGLSAGASATQSQYGNTALPVGQVTVDLHSGVATFNGKPLSGQQDQALAEACRNSGIR